MAKSGDVLEMEALGCRVELLATAEDTGGAYVEFDVLGSPRGLLIQPHVHVGQVEGYEVLAGRMKVHERGREHLLGPGETMEVPADVPHRQVPAEKGVDGHVRIRARPAGQTIEFLERVAQMCADGEFNRFGLPKPMAGARLVADFADTGHAARPPLAVQKAFSKTLLGAANLSRPYVFADEWDVAAPPEAVFDAIADARTYPEWWRPVYLDVDADGPAELGKESRQHFKGRLPYHLHTRSRVTAIDPPHTVTADVDGDLRGRGTWTLTPTPSGTHVRFDWQVHADRKLLRVLTPVLRPVFRWNHNWAIARAMEGLEPYARASGS
jgi:uncharacterized protein YndB with AHSA1/START domain/mannose-6-phosphate isomerase-like protein (cupin superfamily)